MSKIIQRFITINPNLFSSWSKKFQNTNLNVSIIKLLNHISGKNLLIC